MAERSVLQTSSLRVLTERDTAAATELLNRNPVQNAFVAARLESAGLDAWRLGAEVWGYFVGSSLESLCYAGANLVPVAATPEAVRMFVDRALRNGRRCSSLVGPADSVGLMWALLEPRWGPARDVRPNQPLMAIDHPSGIPADPRVRRVRPDEVDVLLPACVAMFTEEVGVSPLAGGGGTLYRARVAELIRAGRAFARIEDGTVLFKAEVGAVTRRACQVQGVWVNPERRGERLSVAGMAAVVQESLRSLSPVVSLYVNDYNAAARAAYTRVGFDEVGRFMSVLF